MSDKMKMAVQHLRVGFQSIANGGAPAFARELEYSLVIVEQEHAEQLRQKDEVIRALADVLEAHYNRSTPLRGFGGVAVPGTHEIILSEEEREKMRAALRLAGRKP